MQIHHPPEGKSQLTPTVLKLILSEIKILVKESRAQITCSFHHPPPEQCKPVKTETNKLV